jgi:hypothetical protein
MRHTVHWLRPRTSEKNATSTPGHAAVLITLSLLPFFGKDAVVLWTAHLRELRQTFSPAPRGALGNVIAISKR